MSILSFCFFLISLAIFPQEVHAVYNSFFFATAPGNQSATCPDLGFSCEAPLNVCAYEGVLNKYYCCSGEDYPICRDFASTCDGTNGGPSSSQIQCTNDDESWCCLQNTETCTQRTGQYNVCLATQPNLIANLSNETLQAEFSSLSSANPTATTFSFDATSLVAAALSTTSTSASSTSTSAPSTSSASSSSVPPGTSWSLSGGAIGGIVVGCIGGIATITAGAYFLLRRRHIMQKTESSTELYPPEPPMDDSRTYYRDEASVWDTKHGRDAESRYMLAEMQGEEEPGELGTGHEMTELPVELEELQGSTPEDPKIPRP